MIDGRTPVSDKSDRPTVTTMTRAIRPKASGKSRRVRIRLEARRSVWLPPNSARLQIALRRARLPTPSPVNFDRIQFMPQSLAGHLGDDMAGRRRQRAVCRRAVEAGSADSRAP